MLNRSIFRRDEKFFYRLGQDPLLWLPLACDPKPPRDTLVELATDEPETAPPKPDEKCVE